MKDLIRKEILEVLDIRDENNFTDIELFKLLDKKRKSLHPDRTTDEVVKKEYEEKVKTLNSLYKKFGENMKVESSNTNIQLYNNEIDFDYVNIKLENDELKGKIESLENEIYLLKSNIKDKDKTIKRLNDTKIDVETQKLKESFRPKKNSLIILGISAILGILIHILSQTEQAVSTYTKYFPMINPNILNYTTLCILISITLIFFISYLKGLIVRRWTEIIKSTEFNIQLFDYVRLNTEPKEESNYYFSAKSYRFKERVIYNFISTFFNSRSPITNALWKIIGLNVYSIFENFKKIIIYELINKGIISISGNSGFDKVLRYDE